MKEFFKTFRIIIRNRSVLILLALIPVDVLIFYVLGGMGEFRSFITISFTLIMIINIFLLISSIRELTIPSGSRVEGSIFEFIWLLLKFFLIYCLPLGILSVVFEESVKDNFENFTQEELKVIIGVIYPIFNGVLSFIITLLLVVCIGSRELSGLSKKFYVLIKNRKLWSYLFVSFIFVLFSKSFYFRKIFSFGLALSLLTVFIITFVQFILFIAIIRIDRNSYNYD